MERVVSDSGGGLPELRRFLRSRVLEPSSGGGLEAVSVRGVVDRWFGSPAVRRVLRRLSEGECSGAYGVLCSIATGEECRFSGVVVVPGLGLDSSFGVLDVTEYVRDLAKPGGRRGVKSKELSGVLEDRIVRRGDAAYFNYVLVHARALQALDFMLKVDGLTHSDFTVRGLRHILRHESEHVHGVEHAQKADVLHQSRAEREVVIKKHGSVSPETMDAIVDDAAVAFAVGELAWRGREFQETWARECVVSGGGGFSVSEPPWMELGQISVNYGFLPEGQIRRIRDESVGFVCDYLVRCRQYLEGRGRL